MALPIIKRFKNAWNAFSNRDPTSGDVDSKMRSYVQSGYGYSFSNRPDRFRYKIQNARNVVAKIYNRIAIDVASVEIVHAKVDEDGCYLKTIDDSLNECLNLNANIDQTGIALKLDAIQSLFDEGCIAIVPIDTDGEPIGDNESFKILSLRVGKVVGWHPYSVDVLVFNEKTGKHETLKNYPKSTCAIIENPFWALMNEPNGTVQQYIQTIKKLNTINDQTASGKLDLIVQLPYVIKSEQRRAEAEKRRTELQNQLKNSALGIGYVDGTEKIVQLNRSLENNLWTQVKDLQTQLYNELGLSQGIFDGSATEQISINYFNNTIAPVCEAICQEMNRKFLSRTARAQGQAIKYFRDPFRLITVTQLADIGEKLRRNEVMTSNEIRSKIGMKIVEANEASTLHNPNMPVQDSVANPDIQMEDPGDGVTQVAGINTDQSQEQTQPVQEDIIDSNGSVLQTITLKDISNQPDYLTGFVNYIEENNG